MKKLVLQGNRVAPNEIWISKLMWHLSIYKTPWRLINTELGIESNPKYLMIYCGWKHLRGNVVIKVGSPSDKSEADVQWHIYQRSWIRRKKPLFKNREIEKKKKESRINEIQIIQYFTTKPQRSRLLGTSNCFELNTTLGKPVLA